MVRLALDPVRPRDVAQTLPWSAIALIGHEQPRSAPVAMLTLAPAPVKGRLCLVEAETGSGKTEAALIHFLDLFREGAVDGRCFALPARAAAKQIHGRIKNAPARLLGDEAPGSQCPAAALKDGSFSRRPSEG